MNIDVHQHVIPGNFFDAVKADPKGLGATLDGSVFHLSWGYDYHWSTGMVDMERRIRELDEARLDMNVISIAPWLMGYAYPVDIARRVCAVINDGLAAIAAKYPSRFIPAATLPMQDVPTAIAELEARRFPAIQIGTNINGKNLDAPELLPFFQAAERLGTFVFLHPNEANTIGSDRLGSYHLRNLIGNPTETALAAASLMFGGVLDACPKLKLCLAHGGGSVPYIWGRWEHGQEVRAEGKVRTKTHISELIKKFYIDTITHSEPALRFLVEQHGADKILVGTDHPADMGDMRVVSRIEALDIPEESKLKILGKTAVGLLGLE
jgi:aminocarboxymuconate-semialdehyde decarboxylase